MLPDSETGNEQKKEPGRLEAPGSLMRDRGDGKGLFQDFKDAAAADFPARSIQNRAQRTSCFALFPDNLANVRLSYAQLNHGCFFAMNFSGDHFLRAIDQEPGNIFDEILHLFPEDSKAQFLSLGR